MITINLPLRICTKKNHRRNFKNTSLPSRAYMNFVSLAGEYLLPYAHCGIAKPFRIYISYHIKGKYPQDIDNATTSILDVLKTYHIIEDDKYCMEIIAKKDNGNSNWLCEVKIEEI